MTTIQTTMAQSFSLSEFEAATVGTFLRRHGASTITVSTDHDEIYCSSERDGSCLLVVKDTVEDYSPNAKQVRCPNGLIAGAGA